MATRQITRFIVRGHQGGEYDIAVEGALDASSASSLRCLLLDLQRDRVTVDLADCTGVSDDAIAALAEAARVAEAHGGDLRLRPTSDASAAGDRAGEPERAPRHRRSLSPAECGTLLAGESIGRIAVTRAGVPHVVPVNYAVVDGAVVFRAMPGTKLAAAELGQPVSFEVDGFDLRRRVGWSVMVSGRTELVTDDRERERVSGQLDSWAATPTDSIVRILPDLVSGCMLSDDTIAVTEMPEEPLLIAAGSR